MATMEQIVKSIWLLLKDGAHYSADYICAQLSKQMPLSVTEIEKKLHRGEAADLSKEVRAALAFLKESGWVQTLSNDVYFLTEAGLYTVEDAPKILDIFSSICATLHASPEENESVPYSQQPTLLIGLGGFGFNLVNSIYGRTKETHPVSAFAVDVDYYRMAETNIPAEHKIDIATHQGIAEKIKTTPSAIEWFPMERPSFVQHMAEGTSLTRAVGRLSFEVALRQGKFQYLLEHAGRLATESIEKQCPLRISIVTSLVGATGSGMFLQIALMLREYLNTHYPAAKVKIHGEFLLPSVFASLLHHQPRQFVLMEANAYAALKELNAINEDFFCHSTSVKLNYQTEASETEHAVDTLPYDYCFLYDQVNADTVATCPLIENAIIERLFSPSAIPLHSAFVDVFRAGQRKNAGNLYGSVSSEKMAVGSPIGKSNILCSVLNNGVSPNGKRILVITSPTKIFDNHRHLLPKETICIENVIPSATEITITELIMGTEISEIGKLKWGQGRYHVSYQAIISQIPNQITPHLNRDWHTTLPDIGALEPTVPIAPATNAPITDSREIAPDAFVFISYSSKEIEVANHVKSMLETNGVSCWMAPQSIPAGSDYGMEIPQAISKCKVFLLLLSEASQTSNWVPKELGLAIGKNKTIVPFQIDNATINDAFNFYLTNSQRISAYNRMTEAYQELLGRLKDILASSAQ